MMPSSLAEQSSDTPVRQSATVLDREVEKKKSHEPSGPRIRYPLPALRLVAREEDKWFCECGYEWNTFDTGGICPVCFHQ